jgi:hypothetical protein
LSAALVSAALVSAALVSAALVSAALAEQGYTAGQKLVGRPLARLGYRLGFSLQANAKTREGASHPTATPSSGTSTPK